MPSFTSGFSLCNIIQIPLSAMAKATDIARYLWMNLRYYDNLETIYIGLDLKLSDLQSEADKRENVLDKIKDAYVSTSNDNIPYIWTI